VGVVALGVTGSDVTVFATSVLTLCGLLILGFIGSFCLVGCLLFV
jgi:hypothetical protein